jgi:heme-degrading monooxygenase HmoA
MAYLLVRTKVKDFEKWRTLFNQHSSSRRQSGSKGGYFFRNVNDPTETIFLLEWDNVENARSFAESAGPVLQEAGLLDQPNVYFLDEVSRPAA